MIFTQSLAHAGFPEEQQVNGHGLTFTSSRFTLAADATTAPAGMRGFIEANSNPSCAYSHLLTLGFSADPSNWRIEFASPTGGQLHTWQRRAVGGYAGGNIFAEPANAAAALRNRTLRLLVPATAAPTSLSIQLGAAEQSALLYATFQRVIAVLHPSPRIGAELAIQRRTTPGIGGETLATIESPDAIFKARLQIDAWESEADLLDVYSATLLPRFGLWPSGLQTQFTRGQAVLYRRPDFVRNMVVKATTGLRGADGLDIEGGPAGLRMDLRETI